MCILIHNVYVDVDVHVHVYGREHPKAAPNSRRKTEWASNPDTLTHTFVLPGVASFHVLMFAPSLRRISNQSHCEPPKNRTDMNKLGKESCGEQTFSKP